MELHPAFWKLGADEDGTVSGLWCGEQISFNPSSSEVPDDIAQPAQAPDQVLAIEQVAASLAMCRDNLDAVLQETLDDVAVAESAAFTELAHIMLGLPRHAAIAASDAPDRPTAEALTKLSIHWTRRADHWRDMVREVTCLDSGSLQPLPTTMALQLCYEELASQDLCAYLTCMSAFGFPGDDARITRLAKTAATLAGADIARPLDEWAAQAASTSDNYSSVKSLRAMGSLDGIDFDTIALDALLPVNDRRWRRTLNRIRSAAETVSFFGFGITHFFKEGGETWPRRKTSWAGV